MADNTALPTSDGLGDDMRTVEKLSLSAKVPVSLIDVGGTANSEAIIGNSGVGMPCEGMAAENAAVVGDPILIGGRYDTAARTLGNGDLGAIALAVDGAVHINDGGNTITVDGTVTANLGAVDNAVLDAIAASLAGTLTVGSHAVTNAGTFAVQAAQAGAWNVTNISGTVSLPTGASTAAKQPALGTAGTASSDVISVQGIASMTPLLVNGSGVTQPVSGTVTAELSATDNAVLDAIAASVAGTLTVGSHAVTNAGTFAVQVSSALPAGTNNIGDVDVLTQPARDRLTDNVGVALQTDVILNDTTALTPKFAAIDAATSGDNTLVAAVVGKKIRVLAVWMVAAAAVTARFEDGASGTALTGQMNLAANGGFVLPFNPVGWFETTANTLLNLELGGAVSVDGNVVYVEV